MKKTILIVLITLFSISINAQITTNELVTQRFNHFQKIENDSIIEEGKSISFFYVKPSKGIINIATINGITTFYADSLIHASRLLIMVKLKNKSILKIIFSAQTGKLSSILMFYRESNGETYYLKLYNK